MTTSTPVPGFVPGSERSPAHAVSVSPIGRGFVVFVPDGWATFSGQPLFTRSELEELHKLIGEALS